MKVNYTAIEEPLTDEQAAAYAEICDDDGPLDGAVEGEEPEDELTDEGDDDA